jgi:hypothetical protein
MTGPPRRLDLLAGVLSYLLPGLGQVLQGRIVKGVLFFVCLHALFFYGLWLGSWRNVWLPEASKLPDVTLPVAGKLGGPVKAVYYRMHFLGQFWIGVQAWPAVIQYAAADPAADPEKPRGLPVLGRYMEAPPEAELNDLQRVGDKRFDLAWVYTVIAGTLNILVICDAAAGPAVRDDDDAKGAG